MSIPMHFAVLAAIICLIPGPLWSATLNVPSDYPGIQLAIDAAESGDTILVQPGKYYEALDPQTKYVTLIGVGGRDVTIIDAGRVNSVIRLAAGGWIEGFTLTNGQAYRGGGIYTSGTVPTHIRNNIITDNQAGYNVDEGLGGGIAIDDFTEQVIVEGNIIQDNYAGDSGGGVWDAGLSTSDVIQDNTISGNACHVGGGGLQLKGALARRNLILNNISDSFAGGVDMIYGELSNNTIVGNHINNFFDLAAGVSLQEGIVTNNIVASNYGPGTSGAGIRCTSHGEAVLRCNVAWNNNGGDFVLGGTCDTTGTMNQSADPRFCDPANGNYAISTSSPCAPGNSLGCGLVGAIPSNGKCGATTIRQSTWGALKARYR